MKHLIWFAAFVWFILMVGTAASQDRPPLVGRIVYANEGDIYVMNADGSDPTRLTTHRDFDPAWSPDGTQIAFRSHRDGDEEVYVMNADGSDQRNLTNYPGGDYSPVWSPDGTQIAFASSRTSTGAMSVFVMDADGSNVVQLTHLRGISEYPTWSPDGTQLAFHCTMGNRLPSGVGDFEICVINADGTNLRQLTDEEGESKLPAWSPDGTQIAFQSSREGWHDTHPPNYDTERFGEYDIYLMDIDGSNPINITNNPNQDDEFPAWSRDGHLIFSRHGCLIVTDAAGANPISITTSRACIGANSGHFPDWYQPPPG